MQIIVAPLRGPRYSHSDACTHCALIFLQSTACAYHLTPPAAVKLAHHTTTVHSLHSMALTLQGKWLEPAIGSTACTFYLLCAHSNTRPPLDAPLLPPQNQGPVPWSSPPTHAPPPLCPHHTSSKSRAHAAPRISTFMHRRHAAQQHKFFRRA